MFRLRAIERETAGRQQPLTAAEIIAIVHRAFGADARPECATEIGAGTVNSTYRLTSAGESPCVLRAGPVPGGRYPSWLPIDTLQREYALTPFLAPVTPLLPKVLATDFTHQLIDRDWVILSLVPGLPWSESMNELSADENASLWRQLGAITRRIHGVAGAAFGPQPPGPFFPRWSQLLANDSEGIIADFVRFGLPDGPARELQDIITDNTHVLDGAGPPRLIHSDLDGRHVFVQRDASGVPVISGIIDHEYGRFADPLSESLLLDLMDHRRPEAAPFFETYGPLPDDTATHWRAPIYRAIVLGWTASDQASQGQDASATIVALAQIVRALAAGR